MATAWGRGGEPGRGGASPELARFVTAPARDGAVRAHSAGVIAPGRNISRADAAAAAKYRRWCDVGRCGVRNPELTRSMETPAFRRAVSQKRAGVAASAGDRDGVGQRVEKGT